MHQHSQSFDIPLFLLLFTSIVVLYIVAAIKSNRKYKKWPIHRYFCFLFGVLCLALMVIGPIPHLAHHYFSVHMFGHLLLGMLAPLLFVLSSPMTLLLKTLNVIQARRLSTIFKSGYITFISHPVIASILNIGGLWALYTTNLYAEMQVHPVLHIFIHVHVFLAGYLFTASMIYIDPKPYQIRFEFRAIVFILAVAFHGILSKYIYGHPPNGVSLEQAKSGGILMYYGGDLIDGFLIFIFCYQWYQASRPSFNTKKRLIPQ